MKTITSYTEQEKVALIEKNGYEVMAMKVTARAGRGVSSSDVNYAYKKGIKYTIDEAFLNVVLLLLETPTNTVAHASSHISSGADAIPTFTAALTGLVPLSGGGTVKYLRADGTWVAPPGAGMVYPGAGISTLPSAKVIFPETSKTVTPLMVRVSIFIFFLLLLYISP